MHRTIRRALAVGSAAVLLVALRSVLGAQSPVPAPQNAIPELLVEVRSLRIAMEQMASAGPRVQLALGRLQLQEQRVNNLLRRQEGTRAALVKAQSDYDHLADRQKNIQEAIRNPKPDSEMDADDLKKLQEQVVYELRRATPELQRTMADDNALSAEIAAEQNRWTDINQKLEELERVLMKR